MIRNLRRIKISTIIIRYNVMYIQHRTQNTIYNILYTIHFSTNFIVQESVIICITNKYHNACNSAMHTIRDEISED